MGIKELVYYIITLVRKQLDKQLQITPIKQLLVWIFIVFTNKTYKTKTTCYFLLKKKEFNEKRALTPSDSVVKAPFLKVEYN